MPGPLLSCSDARTPVTRWTPTCAAGAGWHVGHRIGHPVSEPTWVPILHERAESLPGKRIKTTPAEYARREKRILYREYAKQEVDDVLGE